MSETSNKTNQKLTQKERVFELVSNKENKYLINFANKNSSSLFISAIFDDGIIKDFYEEEFTIEKIKENKAFAFHETIDEILSELFPLIEEGKAHLFEDIKSETKLIRIIFDLPSKKFNMIELYIEEKKKTDLEKINELYNIVIAQNKAINDLRNNLNNLKNEQTNLGNEFKEMKKKMNNLESSQSQILEQKKYEKNLIINLNSKIINSFEDIAFIIERIKNNKKYKDKTISLNLLYKATRDGGLSSDFHKKCDGKVQQLIFIKTTEGEIFGGYTKEGYRSRNESIKDSNAFVFSLSKKKIYNSKKCQNAIFDDKSYGPYFSNHMIHIESKMLENRSETCQASDSYFEGIKSDYEINNGEKYFYIQEIEIYQVLFN
jgi:hypothetical protein